jgi:hypothetical protein
VQTPLRLLFAASLALVLGAPVSTFAQQPGEPAPEAAPTGEGVSADQIPVGPACTYPIDLLWHREPKDASWQMGVSVINKTSGQQVPGLADRNFQILLDGALVPVDSNFTVQQSANTFAMIPTEEGAPPTNMGVDPVNYDVYFSVDMTRSMGDVPPIEGQKPRSKLTWALVLIQNLVQPSRDGKAALFDTNDRVYISGFTSKLETEFMGSTSTKRDMIRGALAKINEFQPTGDSAALYASILHTLASIRAQAGEYQKPDEKREAVVIIFTDSFNGMDLDGRRALRYCNKNDELTDQVQQAIIDTRQATGGNLKVFLLGLGQESEPKYYSLTDPPNRRCRINTVEAETLDGRAFAAIGNPELTRGGYLANGDPRVLLQFVKAQFEALKSAYEVTYVAPEGTSKPRSFKVAVTIGEHMCLDEDLLSSNIIPQATSDADTSATEMALFLAGLIIALFFVPRSLVNLANLGGGGSSEPKSKPKKGKKKKRRR